MLGSCGPEAFNACFAHSQWQEVGGKRKGRFNGSNYLCGHCRAAYAYAFYIEEAMTFNRIKAWQWFTLTYLLLCIGSAALVAVYADQILKSVIIWQFILAFPFWIVVKFFAGIVGGFWFPLAIGATCLVAATLASSIRFSRA
jgi:hypothetical protein